MLLIFYDVSVVVTQVFYFFLFFMLICLHFHLKFFTFTLYGCLLFLYSSNELNGLYYLTLLHPFSVFFFQVNMGCKRPFEGMEFEELRFKHSRQLEYINKPTSFSRVLSCYGTRQEALIPGKTWLGTASVLCYLTG